MITFTITIEENATGRLEIASKTPDAPGATKLEMRWGYRMKAAIGEVVKEVSIEGESSDFNPWRINPGEKSRTN